MNSSDAKINKNNLSKIEIAINNVTKIDINYDIILNSIIIISLSQVYLWWYMTWSLYAYIESKF